MIVAPDPFKTETPITPRGKATYDTIAARLAALNPPISINTTLLELEFGRKIPSDDTQSEQFPDRRLP
jgi:hypothetical protein